MSARALTCINIKIASIRFDSLFFSAYTLKWFCFLKFIVILYVTVFFYLHSDSYHSILTDSWEVSKFRLLTLFSLKIYSVLDERACELARVRTLPILILITSGNFDALNLNYSFEVCCRTNLPCILLSSSMPILCLWALSLSLYISCSLVLTPHRSFSPILYICRETEYSKNI